MEDNSSQENQWIIALMPWLAQLGCLLVAVCKIFAIYLLVGALIMLVKILDIVRVQAFNWCRKLKPSADQAVLITGSTSGIGLAVAKMLYQRGYTIIAGYYSIAEPGYAELVAMASGSPHLKQRILFVNIDVRSIDSIRESHLTVKKLLADEDLKLHALINNAGVCYFHKSQVNSRENIRAMIEINILGPMYMIREYLPTLIKSGDGRIINVSSCAKFVPVPFVAHYSATKSAISHFSQSLALDLRAYPIQVITIFPGDLMSNTALLSSLRVDSERIFAELSEEEKEIFAAEIEAHGDRIENIDRVCRGGKPPKTGILNRFDTLSRGCVDPKVKLENSPVMKSFENAVMLEVSPREMFAGNRYYNYIAGPIAASLSHSTLCWIGQLLGDYVANYYSS